MEIPVVFPKLTTMQYTLGLPINSFMVKGHHRVHCTERQEAIRGLCVVLC